MTISFALSYRDVKELLAERGLDVSYETVRRCRVLKFLGAMACAAPALAAETIRVMIDKLKFAAAQVSAHVGETIEWVSSDFVAHTARTRNKDWTSPCRRRGPVASRCSMRATSTISVAFTRT